MSKSMNNAIGLLESREAIWEKLRIAATCPHRQRRSDPGHPEHCNIFTMHQAFSGPDQIASVDHNCRTAGFGCIDCKKILFANMMAELEPIQKRFKEMNEKPDYIKEVLRSGAAKCKAIVGEVMDEVRSRIGVKSDWVKY